MHNEGLLYVFFLMALVGNFFKNYNRSGGYYRR
jgi:hypothetical protein